MDTPAPPIRCPGGACDLHFNVELDMVNHVLAAHADYVDLFRPEIEMEARPGHWNVFVYLLNGLFEQFHLTSDAHRVQQLLKAIPIQAYDHLSMTHGDQLYQTEYAVLLRGAKAFIVPPVNIMAIRMQIINARQAADESFLSFYCRLKSLMQDGEYWDTVTCPCALWDKTRSF